MAFLFEKLEVYQKALAWAASIDEVLIAGSVGKSNPLYDQLSRAALSIPLNIAEGNGRRHRSEKLQCFMYARGSLLECVAIIQIIKIKLALKEELYNRHYHKLEEISKMLSGLISSLESRRP